MELQFKKHFSKLVVLAFSMSFVLVTNLHCKTEKNNSATEQQYAGLKQETKYVGMETCRGCHQDIYETFIKTGMGKSFDHASLTKSSGNYDNHQPVYDKFHDFYYYPFWENDSLRIMEYRLEGGDTIHKRIETVSYIVGSGQHTNSHISNTGGFLHQMPLTFYTQKGKWDLPPGFENGGNSRFNRIIGLECMSCHNSYPKFTPGSENKYEFVANGINCERCHGPGEAHVNEKRAGKLVDIRKEIDYSIVNPAKLAADKQMDVCQRCHIQGNAVLNEGKTFFDFRPGMKLSDVMHVFMPVYEGAEQEHIMASHAERLKLSKCYTESVKRMEKTAENTLFPSKNSITCITCHDPHVSVKQTENAVFNQACNSCHTNNHNGLCTAKPEQLKLKNNNCVSCHMPGSGATDIPHVSVHDHKIQIPVNSEQTEKIRKFVGIACINEPNAPDKAKAQAFINYFEKFNFGKEVLDSAKKYLRSGTTKEINDNFHELIHDSFLEKNYRQVLQTAEKVTDLNSKLVHHAGSNRDAWTAYRIGESYRETGVLDKATTFLKTAFDLAPYSPDFANKYGSALVAGGNLAGGRAVFEKQIAQYPKYPATLSNLGYLYLVMDNDSIAAAKMYNRALALDPDYAQAIMNKAGLFMLQGKEKEAQLLLKRYLKQKPDDSTVTEMLRQIMSTTSNGKKK